MTLYNTMTPDEQAAFNAHLNTRANKYRIHQFSHGRWHVLGPNRIPVYDDSPNGDDKPLVFTNEDTAIALADRLNSENTAKRMGKDGLLRE